MTELQVDDLSFCESANDSQVQGGLIYSSNTTNGPVVSSFSSSRVFDLDSMMDESLSGRLTEKDLDRLGRLGYRIVSKDGKKVVAGFSGKKNGADVVGAYARVKG